MKLHNTKPPKLKPCYSYILTAESIAVLAAIKIVTNRRGKFAIGYVSLAAIEAPKATITKRKQNLNKQMQQRMVRKHQHKQHPHSKPY